mgnify:CR=1 FL=1
MKKFEGWRTEELQFVANEIIREIRNRRIAEELFQMKLEGIEEE